MLSRFHFFVIFVFISLILLSIKPITSVFYIKRVIIMPETPMRDIYVPPDEYSHSIYPMKNPKWSELHDNNIPGLLPGPRFGENLGLDCNPMLTLKTPIIAPISN